MLPANGTANPLGGVGKADSTSDPGFVSYLGDDRGKNTLNPSNSPLHRPRTGASPRFGPSCRDTGTRAPNHAAQLPGSLFLQLRSFDEIIDNPRKAIRRTAARGGLSLWIVIALDGQSS